FDFPNGDYAAAPTQSEFASGGFRGDLLQVGPDGCIYATQGQFFNRNDFLGARYEDGTTTMENSLVRICGGFAIPPGAQFEAQADGSISGLVYIDLNRNGHHDVNEPGIGGVTVSLGGDSSTTTVSLVDGSYVFEALAAG